MSEREIRVVCFDLGGVVVRICRSFEQACEVAGIEYREPERFNDPELSRKRRELTALHQTGRLSCDAYYRSVSEATGGLYTPEEIRRLHDAWLLGDYPGVETLIRGIGEGLDVAIACLSNTNAAHWRALRDGDSRSAAIDAIGLHFVSHELGAIKPGEEAFRAVERSTGARPGQILLFDDTEENIHAAARLGWKTRHVDHRGDTAAQIRGALDELGLLLPG